MRKAGTPRRLASARRQARRAVSAPESDEAGGAGALRAFGQVPVGLDAAFCGSATRRLFTALVFLRFFLRPALRGAVGADFIRKSSSVASSRFWPSRVSAALRKGMVLPSFSKVASVT